MIALERVRKRWLQRAGSIGRNLLGVTVLIGLGAGVALWQREPSRNAGPQEVVWDKQICDYCKMHIGEPAFAAQLKDSSGKYLFYDDPGCLMRHVADAEIGVEEAFFHHCKADRWIEQGQVCFIDLKRSPMGYGLGAVEVGEVEDCVGYDTAMERLLTEYGPDRQPDQEVQQ